MRNVHFVLHLVELEINSLIVHFHVFWVDIVNIQYTLVCAVRVINCILYLYRMVTGTRKMTHQVQISHKTNIFLSQYNIFHASVTIIFVGFYNSKILEQYNYRLAPTTINQSLSSAIKPNASKSIIRLQRLCLYNWCWCWW